MLLPGYTLLFKRVLYPLYNKIISRDSFGVAKQRIESQYYSREKISEIQFNKLKAVLLNAYQNVPFYKSKFREIGFDPRNMKSISDFENLNFFITKEDIKKNPDAFIAEGCDRSKLEWHKTGGSTGEPLSFPTDLETGSASASAIIRALSWWGIELGERHAMFWGSPQFIVRRRIDIFKKYLNNIRNKLMNRLFISNYNLNEDNIEKYRKKIEKFRPVYVRGMPSSLYVFARYLVDKNICLDTGAPKIVHSACEQLYDWQKEIIEKGFNSKVVNTYGLSELADIAYGAPCGKMHVMEEDVFVELKDFGLGEKEIVATQLNNMMSPLIRYRTADIADSLSQCNCGLNLLTLNGLKGRAHDFIVAPDGRYLHGQFFTHLIVYEQGIQKYQIRQIRKDRIDIKLVVSNDYKKASENRLENAIKDYMGDEVQVSFEYVEKIPLTSADKHRWIISEIYNH